MDWHSMNDNDQIYQILITHLTSIRQDIGEIKSDVKQSVEMSKDNSERIGTLEVKEANRVGRTSALGSIWGAVSSIAVSVVINFFKS